MEELKLLYLSVGSFDASCRMNKEQQETFQKLSLKYKELSGSRASYSVCSKEKLLKRVKAFIDNASND